MSTFWLTNVDPDRVAEVAIELVREDGAPTSPLTWPGLAPFASTRLDLGAEPTVGGGRHAAIVRSSGGQLGSVTYADGPTWGVTASNAVDAAATDLILGYWTRNFYGQTGTVTLFNQGATVADDIAIEWHKDLDPGAPVVTSRLALAPRAARTIDLAAPEDGVDVGDNARGWARVRSSVPLAVQGTLAPSGELAISAAVEAVPAVSAASRWHVPLVYWNWWDGVSMYIESMTFVVNPGSAPIRVTQTLNGLTDDCRGVQKVDVPYDVPAQGAIMLAARPLPGRCAGSARIDATGDVIVTALVNDGEHRTVGLYAPRPLADAAMHAVVPARRGVGAARWTTEFHVLNPGTTPVNAVLRPRNPDGSTVVCGPACTFAVAGGAAVRFDLAAMTDLSDGFDGSVWIDGDGPLHTVAYERNAAAPADGAVFRAVDAEAHAGGDHTLLVPRVVRAVPPTPTPTATAGPSPTATDRARPAPTAAFTPRSTWTSPATVTPIADETSVQLSLPTARSLHGQLHPAREHALLGSFAPDTFGQIIDVTWQISHGVLGAIDGNRILTVMDARADLFVREAQGVRRIGSAVLPRDLAYYNRAAYLSGNTAVLVAENNIAFLDLSSPERPRVARTDALGVYARDVTFDRGIAFVGAIADRNDDATVWAYDVSDPSNVRLLDTEAFVGRIYNMEAAAGQVLVAVFGPSGDWYGARIDATDPRNLRREPWTLNEAGAFLDFDGPRILATLSVDARRDICIRAATAPPIDANATCWPAPTGTEVEQAHFAGDDVVALVGRGDNEPRQRWIVRYSVDSTGSWAAIAQHPLPPDSHNPFRTGMFRDGTACYFGPAAERQGEDGFYCVETDGRKAYVPPWADEPEGEPEGTDDVVHGAFGLGPDVFAVTRSHLHALGVAADGRTVSRGRTVQPGLDTSAGHFVEVGTRTLFHDGRAHVFDIRADGQSVRAEATGLAAGWMGTDGDHVLLVAFDDPATMRVIENVSLREIGRIVLPRLAPGLDAVVDNDHAYLATEPGTWIDVDLSSPGAPRIARTLVDFAPQGFVAVDGMAYVPQRTFHPGRAFGEIDRHDLRSSDASLVGTLDLGAGALPPDVEPVRALFEAGGYVYADLGAGWAARVDARERTAPRVLAPRFFGGAALRFLSVHGRAAVVSDGQLALPDPSADPTQGRYTLWRPWRRRVDARIRMLDDVMLLDDAVPWVYDVRDPRQPRRTGALSGAIASGAAQHEDVLYAPADDGASVRSWALTADRQPAPAGRWCLPDGPCARQDRSESVRAVVASSTHVYAMTDHGLLVVLAAADPSRLRRVAILRVRPLAVASLALIGDHLVALQTDGRQPFRFDVTSPEAPRAVGEVRGSAGSVGQVVVAGSTLAMADTREVILIDALDAAAPRVIDRIAFEGPVHSLSTSEDELFVYERGTVWRIPVSPGVPVAGATRLIIAPLDLEGAVVGRSDVVYFRHQRRRGVEVWTDEGELRLAQMAYLPVTFRPAP